MSEDQNPKAKAVGALSDCPVCQNAYLAIRTDLYKDGREVIYCDCCGATATRAVWNLATKPPEPTEALSGEPTVLIVPSHPESQVMTWTEPEKATILAYGQRCWVAGIKGERATNPPEAWRELFWELALILNCLPSTFVDANAHVIRKARELVATKPPEPTEALSDEQIADIAEACEASDPTDSFWRTFARAVEAEIEAATKSPEAGAPSAEPHRHFERLSERDVPEDANNALHAWVCWTQAGQHPNAHRNAAPPEAGGAELLAALQEIADMIYDPWTNGAKAQQIALDALDALGTASKPSAGERGE